MMSLMSHVLTWQWAWVTGSQARMSRASIWMSCSRHSDTTGSKTCADNRAAAAASVLKIPGSTQRQRPPTPARSGCPRRPCRPTPGPPGGPADTPAPGHTVFECRQCNHGSFITSQKQKEDFSPFSLSR